MQSYTQRRWIFALAAGLIAAAFALLILNEIQQGETTVANPIVGGAGFVFGGLIGRWLVQFFGRPGLTGLATSLAAYGASLLLVGALAGSMILPGMGTVLGVAAAFSFGVTMPLVIPCALGWGLLHLLGGWVAQGR